MRELVSRLYDRRLLSAREGRWRWPWALLGHAVAFGLFFAAGFAISALGELYPVVAEYLLDFGGDQGAVFRPPRIGSFTVFITFGFLLVVPVAISMKLVHGWRIGRVLGPRGYFVWSDFGRAVAAWLLVYLVALGIEAMIFPERYVLRPTDWSYALWLGLAALVILPQAFAEDFVFIGYLGRLWGAILPIPLVVVPLTALCFSSLHASNADVSVDPTFALVVLFTGQVLSLMVYVHGGSLAACFGLHWINNVTALAIISHQPGYKNAFAPIVYIDPVLSAGRSHSTEPMSWLGLVLGFGLLWVLLTWQRSPLAIAPRSLPPDFEPEPALPRQPEPDKPEPDQPAPENERTPSV